MSFVALELKISVTEVSIQIPSEFPRSDLIVEASSLELEVVRTIWLVEVESESPAVSLEVGILEDDELISTDTLCAPVMEVMRVIRS